jgi:deoxyribonuclease V
MQFRSLHTWNVTPVEAVQIQRQLATQVDVRSPLLKWDIVAGADISYNLRSPIMYASVIVIDTRDWRMIETADAVETVHFPYVPGLLSFREAPALLSAFQKLRTVTDVVMLDGQGVAHPRRLGLACHIGLWLDVPCFGCAKSLFVGKFRPPGVTAGALSPLMDGDEQIGYAVRTRAKVQPVIVSAGHRIDLASAVRVTLATGRGYRIPEPTRLAHLRVNELRRKAGC